MDGIANIRRDPIGVFDKFAGVDNRWVIPVGSTE